MTTGDIIFEQDEYKIVFRKNSFGKASFGDEVVNGKGYHFALTKNDVGYKYYSTAVKYPSPVPPDFEKMKTEVIEVLKRFIV